MKSADGKDILIVEDDKDIAFVLSSFLEGEGYKTWEAENGLQGLEQIKAHGVPDLILLDLMMPKMNGWQFAQAFNLRYDHRCPIIVMTAAADAKRRAKEIDATDGIEKPFELDQVLALIKKYDQTQ